MQCRNKYGIYFDIDERAEKAILEFFLANADILRLTMDEITQICLFPPSIRRVGGYQDFKFIKNLENFRGDYVRDEINSEKYNNITQPFGKKFHHYFFKLSDEIKNGFKNSLLFFNAYDDFFYGFEDPAFYKNGEMIGAVISHEPIVILYLTSEEKQRLDKEGVQFTDDSPCGCSRCG